MTSLHNRSDSPPHEDSDQWLTPGKFAILLGALLIACFPQVIFGFESFYFRDYGAFAYPLAFYHREAFWHGQLPFWNPYNFCGVPFLAQWNTLNLYPLSLIYLLLPLSWGLGLFNLAHLFLAGLGMYFLARRWTGNSLAASVAGVVFAFNGLSWYALMWSNNIAALGWMPWVVLCTERAWQKGGNRDVFLAALTGAMQMLTGAPEIIILTWFALGVLWVGGWMTGETPRRPMILRMLIVVGLVACLAAAQLIPFADLLEHSQRDTGFGDSQWSMPLTGWANYLAPLFKCTPGAHGVYIQDGQYWTASYYLGIGTTALAILAIFRVRTGRVWVLAGLAAFSLTMALGDAGLVYAAVRKILPVMGFMRFPIKFVVLATFALPLLAAHAVAWWQSLPIAKKLPERGKLWQLCGVLGAGIVLIIWREYQAGSPIADSALFVTKNSLLRLVFLLLISGCFMLLPTVNNVLRQRLVCVCLLLLFWFDVFTHASNLSPTVVANMYTPDLIRNFHMKDKDAQWSEHLGIDSGRAMLTVGALSKMTFQSPENASIDVSGRRLALWSNYNLLDHIPKFDGFFSLTTRHTGRLVTEVYMAEKDGAPDMPGLKDFLGITEITFPTNAMDWIARNTALPLITIGQQPVFAEDDAALRSMMATDFNPSRIVYLPPETRQSITATNQSDSRILAKSFEPQSVTAETQSSAQAIVVVAQSFYHPWHAYVDGKRVPLLRANYAFQALEVPAGRHLVKLLYEDAGFKIGAMISLCALAFCLAGLVRELFIRSRRG